MLLRFSVVNHLSFKESAELSLMATSLKDTEDGLIPSAEFGLPSSTLPAAIIFGPNAAGKSNIIAALRCMRSVVVNSHAKRGPDDPLPHRPFALDDEALTMPTTFEVDMVVEGIRYNYRYSYNSETILLEEMYSFPLGRPKMLYSREGQSFKFGRGLRGRNAVIAGLTRPNSLFLSAAAQNDHDDLTPVFRFFSELEFVTSVSVSPLEAPSKAEDIDPRAVRFLNAIGTGIVDISVEPQTHAEESKKLADALKDVVRRHFNITDDPALFNADSLEVRLAHRRADGGSTFLDFARESAGTRRLLFLLSDVFRILDKGGIILVDELDASLHTQAFELILTMFVKKKFNPNGAQIIATVHDTNILSSDLIRRDQIWFAEKNEVGNTGIYALSDIKLRSGDNFEKGYLQGRFGALPYKESLSKIFGLELLETSDEAQI